MSYDLIQESILTCHCRANVRKRRCLMIYIFMTTIILPRAKLLFVFFETPDNTGLWKKKKNINLSKMFKMHLLHQLNFRVRSCPWPYDHQGAYIPSKGLKHAGRVLLSLSFMPFSLVLLWANAFISLAGSVKKVLRTCHTLGLLSCQWPAIVIIVTPVDFDFKSLTQFRISVVHSVPGFQSPRVSAGIGAYRRYEKL